MRACSVGGQLPCLARNSTAPSERTEMEYSVSEISILSIYFIGNVSFRISRTPGITPRRICSDRTSRDQALSVGSIAVSNLERLKKRPDYKNHIQIRADANATKAS